MEKAVKISVLSLLSVLSAVLFIIYYSNYIVESAAKGRTFDSINKIPYNKVGLVLGTSKRSRKGYINLYYKYRIDAAVNLFKHGKIKYLLISGDNGSIHYNEPKYFKKDLIKMGIPEDKIYLDFAGFRTLDSVVRAKEIFGQRRLTVISQEFQNKRAIFIALNNGIDAVGFNAKDINGKYKNKMRIREYFARVKAVFDVIFNVKPKFLGEKIKIGE